MPKIKEVDKREVQEADLYGFGFIVIELPSTENGYESENRACFCSASLGGEGLQNFCVQEIALLPFEPVLIAQKALSLKLRVIGIDEIYYDWIRPAWVNESNKIVSLNPERYGKLPLLRGVVRNSDPTIRQIMSIQPLKTNGTYYMAEEIRDPVINAELEKYGTSKIPDAIAGAIEIATDQREAILDNLNQVDEVEEWFGMRRWNQS